MKRAVTEKDVDKLVKDGTVYVGRDVLLTPSAREQISKRGYKVVYGEEKEKASPPVPAEELARMVEAVVRAEISRAPDGARAAGPTGAPGAVPAAAPGAAMPAAAEGPAGMDTSCLEAVLSMPAKEGVGSRAIVAVVGHNRPGIVARISAVVAENGGDLADISQTILDKYFSMIFIVNLAGVERKGLSFRVFKEKLQDEAVRIGQVQVIVMHEEIFQAMHKV